MLEQSEIKRLIETKGAMGVNALSKELDVPLSTMQKHMHKQSYFKMNGQRKWDLPERVVANETIAAVNNVDSVIDSQLSGITALSEMLVTQIKSTVTLLGAQKTIMPPVADSSLNGDPNIAKISNLIQAWTKAIKQYKDNIPEEYLDLILNLDISRMAVEMGLNYINSSENADFSGLLIGERDILTEETLKVIEMYQK